jgi:hypothetical protein
MDELYSTVKIMTESWRADFRVYINTKTKKSRILDLFDVYAKNKEMNSKDCAHILYKKPNTNALYALRRELSAELTPFVVKKRNEQDVLMPDAANAKITYALLFLEHHLPELAIDPLDEAEKIARFSRQYDTLMRLYEVKIKYAKDLKLRMAPLSNEWTVINSLRTMKLILTNSVAFLNEKIEDCKSEGKEIDTEHLMKQFYFDKLQYVSDIQNPVLQYISVTAARTIYIASKNYLKIEPLIRPIYESLESNGSFTEADADIKSDFIYFITHALYRGLAWKESLHWLEVLQGRLPKLAAERNRFFPKYILLSAAIATCTNQNELAIDILENALKKKDLIPNKKDLVNMHLNLAVYYFQKKSYERSLQIFSIISAEYSPTEQSMGREWKLKKDMIEMIIQYELGNDHQSRKLLKKLRGYYQKMLDQTVYSRANDFLQFIEDMLNDGTCVTTKGFLERIREAKKGWENTEDDLQAIAFFCWLKSKMLQRDYYEVLVERLQRPLKKAAENNV